MISPLAYVHPEAKIGANVTIDPFAFIDRNVEIGEGTHIMSNAVISYGSRIGKSCLIFPGSVIGGIPQDLKFVGEETTVEIGDRTTVRECVTINRGTKAKGKTVIGSNNLLMAYVHVGHDCIIGNGCVIVNSVLLAGEVEVGDFAIIGGASAVMQFTRIGAHTYIGGFSQIRKDVPPYVRAAREPLCYIGINSVGLRRRGFSNETIYAIQDMYRHIYQSDMNTSQALDHIEATMAHTPERDEVVNFIRNGKKGIMKGFNPSVNRGSSEDDED
jgi:UDP-N-acetylglucosamine acyltransferase